MSASHKAAVTLGRVKNVFNRLRTFRLPSWLVLPRPLAILLVLLFWAGVGVLATFTSAPDELRSESGAIALAGMFAGLLVSATFSSYRRLRPVLGTVTSVAALAIAWAGVWGVAALLVPECPGYTESVQRCTTADVGSYLLVGVLLPASFAAFVLPLYGLYRFARWSLPAIVRRYRRPVEKPAKSSVPTSRRARREADRVAARAAKRSRREASS